MASDTQPQPTEVQGVITPALQVPVTQNGKGGLEKLESILASSAYLEMMESCKNFNKRLLVERKGRVPFIDAHTGLAQTDCRLWMEQRQRMPGVKPGQVYTYPAKRWVKRRRQYLNFFMQPKKFALEECELSIASVQNPTFTEDSVNSVNEGSKDAWFYEDAEMDRDDFEENSDNSDFDFDDRYRKKKKSATGSKRSSGRGSSSRRRTADPEDDSKKPWACELCSARYKTRPGLTYHYAHSHKEERRREQRAAEPGYEPPPPAPDHEGTAAAAADDTDESTAAPEKPRGKEKAGSRGGRTSRQAAAAASAALAAQADMDKLAKAAPPAAAAQVPAAPAKAAQPPVEKPERAPPSAAAAEPAPEIAGEKKRTAPSLYCDFCLGDAQHNKKTGAPEELVSCSDCGRSGHPTCLQFTDNMVISVKKYRWQCIECKCCSLCGTSDNDDQLLFCDDCDRGYHMYCLSPPLTEPPEGSWSCHLCVREFHAGVQPASVPQPAQ
ncbi:zinc finger protein ubi-d4 B-like isoform X1 [Amphibalanus amphitrite]|uniref:zinc finger protein ubi-d4 B-like isoform X1 n=1 Tax=Amphibalanus amphitrite TaxID=1232801 RepID=UPI001C902439|nr:zinc finger protein ubi-d4 B-like isoform X1 [Amphibalanus amphitrite]